MKLEAMETLRFPESLPSRERGLKLPLRLRIKPLISVAPLAGAWIEINTKRPEIRNTQSVAPLAGAWIEM